MSEHWSKDGLHCIHCGADSNLSHIPSCPNYGLYDNDGNPIPVFPKVTTQIKVTEEELGTVDTWWRFSKMRVGRRKLRTLYLMEPGNEDRELDILIGLVDTPDLAMEIVRRWNLHVPN